jgi:hypothetical protein
MTVASDPDPDVVSLAHRLLSEGLKPLAQAARKLPSFRNGRPTSPGCLWRWATRGARAADGSIVKLETVNLCRGRLLTSEPALARFLARLTAAAAPADGLSPSPSPSRKRRAAEQAGQELERLGL